MPLASKWLDLVVGLDLHLEITPAGPVPFPHPFVGLVGDPAASLVAEIVATVTAWLSDAPPQPGMVTIAGFRATITGDTASMPVPHIVIPPGLAWAPVPRLPSPPVGLRGKVSLPDPPLPPPSRASMLLGSQTVKMMGANAVRSGELALSCSDPVPLPTSQVVSTGMGRAVMIGGPPGIDWQQAVASAGVRSPRVAWAGVMAKAIPEVFARARSILPVAERVVTGHPVAVTTGSVLTDAIDFALPGAIPLRLHRHYDSNACDRDSPLGFGWSHALDIAVWIEPHAIVMRTDDGREIEFGTRGLPDGVMRRGDVLRHPVDRVDLRALGELRWEVERPDGVVLELGPVAGDRAADRGMARLLRLRTLDGAAVQLHYDGNGRLVEAIDAAGRRVAFEHDARGRLLEVWLPAAHGDGTQRQASFRYSDDGDLIEVRDANGHATRYAYEDHLLVAETDRNGLVFRFRYDGFGPRARCMETWGIDPTAPQQAIHHHVLEHDRENRRTVVTTSLGEATVYAYDGAFMVVQVTDACGGVTTYTRDAGHRVVEEVDPLGRRTTRTYDARGDLVRTEQPGGRVTELDRDAHGRLVGERGPVGAQRSWTRDRYGRVTAEVDAAGHRSEYAYEDARRVAVIDAAGQRTTIEHDAAGNVVGITTPTGAAWRWAYDAHGRVVQETDPTGGVWRWSYDAMGRVVRVEAPDGHAIERELDPEGHAIRERDAAYEVALQRRGRGWLASYAVGGEVVRFEHDAEGRWVAVTDAAGRRHERELDMRGAVRRAVDFDGRAIAFVRDAVGRVVEVVRASGRATKIAWSDADCVERIDHDGGPAIEYGWREDGALVRAACDGVVVELDRDALASVTKESCGDAHVVSTYDHRGLRSSVSSSRGSEQQIVRNAVGDPQRVVARAEGGRVEITWSRDAAGREIDRRLPGDARAYWWRDAAGRPTQQFVGREGGSHRVRRWEWAGGDRLARIVDGDDAIQIERDACGRVVREVARDVVHRFDAEGRRIASEHADGRQWRYHWDGASRLVQVDRPDGTAVTFAYDALGRRVLRNAAGRVTRWQWDGDVPLHEWSEEGEPPTPREPPAEASRRAARLAAKASLLRTRGAAGEAAWLDALRADAIDDPVAARLLAEYRRPAPTPAPLPEPIAWAFAPETFAPIVRIGARSGALAIVGDALGTPSHLVDDRGEIVWELDCGDPTACPFRHPGQYDDREVGLVYNRHRWLDPETNGYLSPDPIGLAGGLAPHAWVDDPFVQCDPLGLCVVEMPHIDLRSPIAFRLPPDPQALALGSAIAPRGPSPGVEAAVGAFATVRDLG